MKRIMKLCFLIALITTLPLYSQQNVHQKEVYDSDSSSGKECVRGEFIVGYKKTLSPARMEAIHQAAGTNRKSYLAELRVELVKVNDPETTREAMSYFSSLNNEVEYVEPNYIRKPLIRKGTPNDKLWSKQWSLNNNQNTHIDILKAWNITRGSKNTVVAVLDTGIDYNHEDLRDNMWVNVAEKNGRAGYDDDKNGYVDDIYGYDFLGNDGDPMDDYGHGTHCAGIIGAKGGNGKGIIGVCPEVSIMALRIDFSDFSLAKAFTYAGKMGAHITNCSWGGPDFGITLRNAMESFTGVHVVAAGNDAVDIHKNFIFPAAYDIPNLISVGATDIEGKAADYSCYGYSGVDIFAPGTDILSSVPGESSYEEYSGTSMAAPHVSGVAALLKSKYPEMKTEGIINNILMGTRKGNYQCTTRGMLNAYLALTKLSKLGTRQIKVKINNPGWALKHLGWRWQGSKKIYRSGQTVTVPNTDLYLSHSESSLFDFMPNHKKGTFLKRSQKSSAISFYNTFPIIQSNGFYKVQMTREKTNLDISKTGKVISRDPGIDIAHLDLSLSQVSLGFPFEFYRKQYDSVKISPTGLMFFGKVHPDYGYLIYPLKVPGKEKVIAPFWTQHVMPGLYDLSDKIYYQTRGKAPERQFIMQFEYKERIKFIFPGTLSTTKVQVVLNEKDNSFEINYNHPVPLIHSKNKSSVTGAVWAGPLKPFIWFNPRNNRFLGGATHLKFTPDRTKKAAFEYPDVDSIASLKVAGDRVSIKARYKHPKGKNSLKYLSFYLYSSTSGPTTGAAIRYDLKKKQVALNVYQDNQWLSAPAGSTKMLQNRYVSFRARDLRLVSKGDYYEIQASLKINVGFSGLLRLFASAEDVKGNFSGIIPLDVQGLLNNEDKPSNKPVFNSCKLEKKGARKAVLSMDITEPGGLSDLFFIQAIITHKDEPEVDWYGTPFKPGLQLEYNPDAASLLINSDHNYYETVVQGGNIKYQDSCIMNNAGILDIGRMSLDAREVKITSQGKKLHLTIPFTLGDNLKKGTYNVLIQVLDKDERISSGIIPPTTKKLKMVIK